MTSKLILGTVQFGLAYGINNKSGQINQEEVFRILDHAYGLGIQTLDTASAYGSAETILGIYFNQNPDKGFKIITKLGIKNQDNLEEALRSSLIKLGTTQIDTLLFHSYRDYKSCKQEWVELIERNKKVSFNKFGVSVYTNDELESLIDDDFIDIVQAPFNLLDNETQRGEIFRKLKGSGKVVHTRSAFLQGIFFKPVDSFPEPLEELKKPIIEIKKLSEEYGIPMHRMALVYALSKDYIDGVLFGVDSLEQLKMNGEQIQESLPLELITAIDSIEVNQPELLNPSLWKN